MIGASHGLLSQLGQDFGGLLALRVSHGGHAVGGVVSASRHKAAAESGKAVLDVLAGLLVRRETAPQAKATAS